MKTNKYSYLYNESDIDLLAMDENVFDYNLREDEEPALFIQVSAECEVTCIFLDFIRRNVLREIQHKTSGYVFGALEMFDLFLSDYLNVEGLKAVEACINYMIHNGELPLVCSSSRRDTDQRFMRI